MTKNCAIMPFYGVVMVPSAQGRKESTKAGWMVADVAVLLSVYHVEVIREAKTILSLLFPPKILNGFTHL